MKIHILKIHPAYFEKVLTGEKKFEIRKDDRGFQSGDRLLLKEWDPERGCFTGRSVECLVNYILRSFEGLMPGYVAMSISITQ